MSDPASRDDTQHNASPALNAHKVTPSFSKLKPDVIALTPPQPPMGAHMLYNSNT
nr:MAG TPA: hypothetical protein [Caudoviricetes sp.]